MVSPKIAVAHNQLPNSRPNLFATGTQFLCKVAFDTASEMRDFLLHFTYLVKQERWERDKRFGATKKD